jgi:serine/threonine protein kinase
MGISSHQKGERHPSTLARWLSQVPQPIMNELAGHHLGGYFLEEEVGRGAMGVVYRAKQLTLGREVAVKVLPQGLARDASYVARFTREARIIAGLNHPNIVQIYDAGEQQNLLFFAMEFVQGPTLANLLYLDGTISPYYAVEYAAQIADALDAAYRERNVIHRDIKPENLMLSRWGKIKVMDFGLARAPGLQVITVAKTLVGSIYYASPEQIWGEIIDNRSDIYALGVVLYEMVCGRRPFSGRTMPEVTQTIVQGILQPPSTHNPNVSVELEQIILTALARNRDDRYEDASIMARELRNLHLDPPTGPIPSQATYGGRGKATPYLPKRPQVTLPRYLTLEQENTQALKPQTPQGNTRVPHPAGDVPQTPILPPYPQNEEERFAQEQQLQSYSSQEEDTQQNPKSWNQFHKLFKTPE